MFKILVDEDDKNLQQLMRTFLERAGYEVKTANDGTIALGLLQQTEFDLIITDLMMPHMDGYELSRRVREMAPTPILMETAKEELVDKKRGFSVGADDYMVKPIEFEEMLLRVSAILRRSRLANEKIIDIGNTRVDYNNLTVSSAQKKTEYSLKAAPSLNRQAAIPE